MGNESQELKLVTDCGLSGSGKRTENADWYAKHWIVGW